MTTTAHRTDIAPDALEELLLRALTALGLDAQERRIVADVLLYAELRGRSQGLIKVVERTVLPAADRTPLRVLERSPCVHHVLGNGNIGMVVLRHAADRALQAVARFGVALVGTSGTASSTGSIGYYAERIARAGYIGIVLAGSPKVMAPAGGVRRAFGTNPIAFAAPTRSDPIVFDMATSAVTWFEIIRRERAGEELPDGVALDSAGRPTRIPAEALRGVLLPFAAAKGSGLALMFELLTGPLNAAAVVGDDADCRGNLVLALDPDVICPQQDFVERASLMLDRIRDNEAEAGTTGFRLPGERAARDAARRLAAGLIAVDSAVLDQLRELAGDA